jgi:hypothetical protein
LFIEIRAAINSVSETADHPGIFSTCSFITNRMMKEHVSEGKLYSQKKKKDYELT